MYYVYFIFHCNTVRFLHVGDEPLHLAHSLLAAVGNDILCGLNFKNVFLPWIVCSVYVACFGHTLCSCNVRSYIIQ